MTSELRVALVTGAGSGIGRASALRFAADGCRVAVADVDEDGGHQTVRLIEDVGGEAAFFPTDVTDERQVQALVAGTLDAFGRLDCAHNNAGIAGPLGSTTDLDVADFRRLLEVNVVGVFLCMKHEIPVMLRGGGGAIVNTSSGAGLGGVPFLPGYSATKHAVVGLTKSAAMEYGGQGVRVNAVCPGPIATPMLDGITAGHDGLRGLFVSRTPMAREGTPEEVAELVVWLCSPAASYMDGACIPVDGGSTA
ncbi:MAG: SDR family oxidoreductase [Actinobacteria bacterium]|nr:SDR family oxidoreductase [Actinomycetota bacterium]